MPATERFSQNPIIPQNVTPKIIHIYLLTLGASLGTIPAVKYDAISRSRTVATSSPDAFFRHPRFLPRKRPSDRRNATKCNVLQQTTPLAPFTKKI
jgi:hypothetical protein